MSRRDDRRTALTELYAAEAALELFDDETLAAGPQGPAQTAYQRAYDAADNLPRWRQAYVFGPWRLRVFCLRHPIAAWKAKR